MLAVPSGFTDIDMGAVPGSGTFARVPRCCNFRPGRRYSNLILVIHLFWVSQVFLGSVPVMEKHALELFFMYYQPIVPLVRCPAVRE